MKKIAFIIEGMDCASCAVQIEKVLKRDKRIHSADVNFHLKQLNICVDDEITEEIIQKIIGDLGYIAHLVKEKNNQSHNSAEMSAHDHHQTIKESEIKTLWKKFLLGAVCSVFVVILGLPEYFSFIKLPLSQILTEILLFIFTAIIEFYVGWQFWKNSLRALKNLMLDMDFLVALGTGAAFIYSASITFFKYFGFRTLDFGFYYDVSAVVITLVILGKYLEAKSSGKASQAIKGLLKLQAKTAHLIKIPDDDYIDIPVEEIKVGDILLIKPGEKIPTDGEIIEGEATIDESMITGESIPIERKTGDKVIGATINLVSPVKIKATKIGKETFLAQIIKIVEEAQSSKPPIQKFLDKIIAYFVPFVILVAVSSFFLWLIFGATLNWALFMFISVLVVACPCAIGLATPVSLVVASGKAAQNGIIIKNAGKLEIFSKINAIVFDKTGTLTKGKPAVKEIILIKQFSNDEEEILKLAGGLANFSNHPLSIAITEEAKKRQLKVYKFEKIEQIVGKGLRGEFDSKEFFLGNKKFVEEQGMGLNEIENNIMNLENQGKTVNFIFDKNQVLGIITLADELKDDVKEIIAELQKKKINIWMITGDNERTASAIAKEIGIKNIMASVLPQEKQEKIKELQMNGKIVAAVGDGINDAPMLTQADIGIAIGAGTDVAIESGDIVLVGESLGGVLKTANLSKSTLNNIKQNVFWAFAYNIVLIPVAAGVLYPFFSFALNPILAGGAMAFSSVSVVLNSLRLNKIKLI